MATYIDTLQDDLQQNYILPRTVLKALFDDNGNYLDSGLTASDINALKNGKIASMSSQISDLITYGSDSNGSYAKFSNGIMVCWGTKDITIASDTWTQWGGLYISSDVISFSFPVNFISMPFCVVNILSSNYSMGLMKYSADTATVSSTGSFQPIRGSSVLTVATGKAGYFAIGRWK